MSFDKKLDTIKKKLKSQTNLKKWKYKYNYNWQKYNK
jgi:hypothetical protein